MARRVVSTVLFFSLLALGLAAVPGASASAPPGARATAAGPHRPAQSAAQRAAAAKGLHVRWDALTGLPRTVTPGAKRALTRTRGDLGQALVRWLRANRDAY